MRKSRFTEEQIALALRQVDAGVPVAEGAGVKGQQFLFSSKELDEETGLYYFGARYYDPERVRRESADPALEMYLPSTAQPHKARQGFLFRGKYVTLRDAGNMLFGINMQTHGVALDDALRGAGAWVVKKSIVDAFRAYLGKTYGPPPYYGEDEITGTRIDFGYRIAPSIPDNRAAPSFDLVGP